MTTFCLHASAAGDRKAKKFWARGARGTYFNILGDCTVRDDVTSVQYSFSQAFTETYIARARTIHWSGTLMDDGKMLSGKWGYDKDNQPYTFIYTRIPPEAHFHTCDFTATREKTLWKHAQLVALSDERRRRETFLELLKKAMDAGQLTELVSEELSGSYDKRFELDPGYLSCSSVLQDFRQRTFPVRA